MYNQDLVDGLIDVCKSHIWNKKDEKMVIDEPYIPFITEQWNRYLIVAEAQNLNDDTNGEYVEELMSMNTEARICRLYERKGEAIGIGPWDEGTLKLALVAAFPKLNVGRFAVSNAVLWSRVSDGRNSNPTPQMKDSSSLLWSEMLPILKPQCVITVGKVAEDVVSGALRECSYSPDVISICSSSRQYLSRISEMFNKKDLLNRYPEVNKAYNKHRDWVGNYCQNKIFFACHVVSVVSQFESNLNNKQDKLIKL